MNSFGIPDNSQVSKAYTLYMLTLIPFIILACVFFLLKAKARQQWQKKFWAAALLLIANLSVLIRYILIYKKDLTCFDVSILTSLYIQSVAQTAAFWVFARSIWVDSIKLQQRLGLGSFFTRKVILGINILIWLVIITYGAI